MKCQLKKKCIHIQALWTNMIDCQSQPAAHSIWAFVKDICPVISDIAEEKQTRTKEENTPYMWEKFLTHNFSEVLKNNQEP